MQKARPPARLTVLMARDAPYAVIIRRGPYKHVCTVGWHRKTDHFELGQWMIGRIYEDRCDISPNGAHLIYSAAKFQHRTRDRETWTAISRAPYLKATGLWQNGTTWMGGGIFLDDRTVVMDGLQWTEQRQPHGLRVVIDALAGSRKRPLTEADMPPGVELERELEKHVDIEARPIFVESRRGMHDRHELFRMYRDGWRLDVDGREGGAEWWMGKWVTRDWWLRKPTENGGYELVSRRAETTIPLPAAADWAEVDRYGKPKLPPKSQRLVWTAGGMLFAANVSPDGLGEAKIIYDFNEMEFEAIPAPY
jgi:hypothetical protein